MFFVQIGHLFDERLISKLTRTDYDVLFFGDESETFNVRDVVVESLRRCDENDTDKIVEFVVTRVALQVGNRRNVHQFASTCSIL